MDQEDGEYLYNGMLATKNEILPRMADIVWYHLHVESKKYNKLGSECNNNNKKADSHLQRKD